MRLHQEGVLLEAIPVDQMVEEQLLALDFLEELIATRRVGHLLDRAGKLCSTATISPNNKQQQQQMRRDQEGGGGAAGHP